MAFFPLRKEMVWHFDTSYKILTQAISTKTGDTLIHQSWACIHSPETIYIVSCRPSYLT